MSTPLRLEYALTGNDMEQAKTLCLNKRIGGGSEWKTVFIMLTLMTVAIVGAWFRFREIPVVYRALLLGGVVAGSVVYVFVQKKFRKSVARPTVLEVSEKDLTFLSAGSRAVLPWSSFGECLESPGLFVLMDRPKKMFYAIPKRAFPSEASQTWFRELAALAPGYATPEWHEPPTSARPGSPDCVTITAQPTFRDGLAAALAAWRIRGICLAGAVLVLVPFSIGLVINPPPPANADDMGAAFLIVFVILSYLAFVTFFVVMYAVQFWRANGKGSASHTIAFSREAVAVSGTDGSGTLPWTTYGHYKETRRYFFLWGRSQWLLLAKRYFASDDELSRFRDLLSSHLKPSRWFIG
jgi:hypothetical protein